MTQGHGYQEAGIIECHLRRWPGTKEEAGQIGGKPLGHSADLTVMKRGEGRKQDKEDRTSEHEVTWLALLSVVMWLCFISRN